MQAEVTCARDRAESDLLSAFTDGEQKLLRALLTRLAAGEPGSCLEAGGSCI
jgi:hypothetical protein